MFLISSQQKQQSLPYFSIYNSSSSSQQSSPSSSTSSSSLVKIGSAFFYGISSMVVIFINKIILSEYQFHHFYFLGAVQFGVTCFILIILALLRKVELPPLSMSILTDIAPVFLLFFGNVMCGLGSTQSLNLPMFTVLRRFSILMSMIGEYYILGIIPSYQIIFSVFLMIFGAAVAAMFDISYDFYGYVLVLLNDIFTALNGVYLKKATISKKCSKIGVLFYNSLLSFLSLCVFFIWNQITHQPNETQTNSLTSKSMLQEIIEYPRWSDWKFLTLFIFTAAMGSVLNYSIFLCTTINSPLTTAVIGCMKNILVTYFSMIFMTGYSFEYLNFIGLNISIIGSIIYAIVAMKVG